MGHIGITYPKTSHPLFMLFLKSISFFSSRHCVFWICDHKMLLKYTCSWLTHLLAQSVWRRNSVRSGDNVYPQTESWLYTPDCVHRVSTYRTCPIYCSKPTVTHKPCLLPNCTLACKLVPTLSDCVLSRFPVVLLRICNELSDEIVSAESVVL